MNVLVTGASGFLGRTILQRGKNDIIFTGTHFTNYYDGTLYLDVTNKDLVEKVITESKSDIVIHCASLRNTISEKDPNLANLVNVEGTKNIVDTCKKFGIHLIYVSSDSVFDGEAKINDEKTNTNPLGVFGRNKVNCESMISKNLESYCILRTSLLFGWDSKQSNFVQWVISELNKNREIHVISDQYVSPSYSPNVADIVLEAAVKRITGLYNASGKECLTRFAFALKIAKVFNLDDDLLIPLHLNSLNLDMKRGRNCCLDVTKLLSDFKTPVFSIEQALIDMRDNSSRMSFK